MHAAPRSLVAAMAFAAALTACSDQAALNAPLPPGAVLTGEFGGRSLQITATDTAALLLFVCASGRTSPLQVNVEGALEATGTASPSWPPGTTQALHLTARLRGNALDVTVTIGTGSTATAASYLLYRDVPGDFSGYACAD
jgi:hypothetical protein